MPRSFALPGRAVALALLIVVGAVSCRTSGVPPLVWTRHADSDDKVAGNILVLMFPGVGDDGESYVDHGFVQSLQNARRGVDIVTVDASRQYFGGRTLLARIEKDVLVPARQRGYAQTWIVGLSMGGAGALLTARHFQRDIDGLVLIAPYLGHRCAIARIARAGGVRKWKPPKGRTTWTIDLWRWLRGYVEEAEDRPKIYLASGTEDMWAEAHEILAEVIPAGHVFSAPGGHAWTVWSPLWVRLLDAGVIGPPPTGVPARTTSPSPQ